MASPTLQNERIRAGRCTLSWNRTDDSRVDIGDLRDGEVGAAKQHDRLVHESTAEQLPVSVAHRIRPLADERAVGGALVRQEVLAGLLRHLIKQQTERLQPKAHEKSLP